MYSHFDWTTWVTPFGLIFLGAIFTAWFFARRNATSISMGPSHVDLLVPIAIIVGVVGGTIMAVLMPMDQMVAGTAMTPGVRVRLFAVIGSGAVALFVYSRIAKLPFRRLLDVFALPTVAALMVHRIGCFLAGCCWGDIVAHQDAGVYGPQVQTTSFLQGIVQGVQYPPGSLPHEQHLAMDLIGPGALASLPVYPVQLYEAGLLLVMLILLSRVPWKRCAQGTLAILAVCSYALLRFLIEYLRADGHLVLGNLTVTQLQCIILLVAIVLLPRWRKSVVS